VGHRPRQSLHGLADAHHHADPHPYRHSDAPAHQHLHADGDAHPNPDAHDHPTPSVGLAARPIWARSGCYESFNAIGKIPEGGELRFLPSERRFDDFNRECVLVEYQGPDRSVIGWVLFPDVVGKVAVPEAEVTVEPTETVTP
jgi:hypothetical protein